MISVVIPLYNKAHTITRTLSTVLEQTFSEFEIVIINDGSTDKGTDVISNYTNDKRVRIIDQVNQGVSVARNQGVLHAKYEYIAFLDGDDEWLPTYLETMYAAITEFPNAGFICCAGKVRSGGRDYLRLADKYSDQIVEIDFFQNPHVFLHSSATVVTKTIFNTTSGFPVGMKQNEDYALFFLLGLLSTVVYCGYPLSIYVGDVQGQATTATFEEVMSDIIKRYNLVFKAYNSQSKSNKSFVIFMKYELRHTFLILINQNKYNLLQKFIDGLDQGIITQFSGLERYFFKNEYLKPLAKALIYSSKLRWRLRKYPRIKY
ncbi:glycosyltransferase family A protein [Cellulophaga sp. L1A9]|uniref:glycosyltransferase family 2 protein n=1 Tax=Cellulophaga sp. L1A9 TaxID=2686362 RepID=UPI00131A763A|nr:glycosyltransferase family A protein [Cellulophaga sp. L1A9]